MKKPEFRPYIVCRHTSTGLDPASAMGPDHKPKKIAMPMTALRSVVWASRP